MKNTPKNIHDQIQDFIHELSSFATTAEGTLKLIESDLEGNKHYFSIFSDRMLAIRGTTQQLNMLHIAGMAELGEEIALKAATANSRAQIRKCVGSLWDALTTIKYLLEHYQEETNEEQNILIQRLQNTLRILGGARQKVDANEIEELLRKRN